MARQKNDGKGRLGGRSKGTPNKVTNDVKEWIASFVNSERERFETMLSSLEPNDYIKAYINLLGYVLPKQAPINPENILEKERVMLQELILTSPDILVERVARRLNELNKIEHENKIES